MINSSDPEFEKEDDLQEEIIEVPENIIEPLPEDKSLVISENVFPETLLIVPLYDRPLFPKMLLPVIISDENLEKELLEDLKGPVRYVGLVYSYEPEATKNTNDEEVPDKLAKIGAVGRIVQASKHGNDPLHIIVQVMERFEIIEIVDEDPVTKAKVEYLEEIESKKSEEELKAFSVSIINMIKELVQLNPLFKEELGLLMGRINLKDPATLADFAASMTTASGKELQEILETKSIKTRIEKALNLLRHELEVAKLQVKISQRVEDRMSQQQREFFLREQLKEIKKELGLTKEGSESETERYEARIKKLKLSEEAKERIDEELEKLRLIEPASPEYNVTRTYLDWLTILPWGIYSKDFYNIQRAARILDRDHYGLKDVKDRILELISVGIINGDLAGSIVLLVGPPGTGKTSVGQSIARAIGRKFFRFSLGGMRDEAEIKGHRRTYIGALPGKFINAIKTCKTSNPVIMLDEIDKVGASFHGDPASALLEVLDPEQNKDFLDHYLDVRFDLSKVLFICTANQTDSIPPALLDRMEVIRLSGYILEEKLEIARKHLLPKQLKTHGLKKAQFSLPKPVLREIIDGYAREAGVRSLENNLKKLLRKSARIIVENEVEQVKITKDDLPKMLGRKTFAEESRYKKPKIGVITGLAYTSVGGATLFIEASSVEAKNPGFKQTGQLGDVMVESTEIAYTFIRSLGSTDEKIKSFFAQNFVHLHVPAGATPKDGPSAGITMACALHSLVSQEAIISNIAMTGELTLTGLVMPIGGVKEKTIAARRAGITQLIFPAENQKDFDDLDDSIKVNITPYFVKTFQEVLPICFPELKGTSKKRIPKS
ncbi:MAG: endopeptidase La [SAR324 cluster bacterium]|nr:endopeptidase La [SAR324 cluster bacterium]MBL7034679.1 endopeptidase La [SAR324 cluster bacterium]